MRRIVIAVMSTVSGLVLLFSYPTSTNSSTVSTALPQDGSASGTAGGTGGGTASGSAPSSTAADTSGNPAPTPTSATDDGAAQQDGTAQDSTQSTPANSAPAASPSSRVSGTAQLKTGTFTGDAVMTRWGIVQVKITVKANVISASTVVQVPMANGHDREINNYAVPILDQRVVDAQSAAFDSISGATVTSDGYKQSLQTAIDKAHA